MKRDGRLIVALDVDSYRAAARLVKQLTPSVKIFKVGSILFTQCGPKIINYIHKKGGKVFLDLKYNDIPNTVAGAAMEATRLGVYMLNVHALAGKAAMQATVEAVSQEAKKHHLFKPIVIAVTILTSLQDEDLGDLGLTGRVHDNVMRLATLAKEAGLDGIVCSPQEIKMIKDAFGDRFVTVTPGIRPAWAS
ncbi:MAG: orotidine-5'-phosphate decarboxylase, partial [Candidatus Omnitrophica bacterium]|nr:orotidine-5'-phosphate decarboxylase [Candidatus Omnitrophota bacterium]